MAKLGPFITDPNAGAYCQVTLDSGEKLIVNHEKGGFKGGRLTIEVSKFMGFRSERILSCDLDSPQGKAAIAQLTREARQGSVEATPLGAFVEFVTHCASVGEVKTRCNDLLGGLEEPPRAR